MSHIDMAVDYMYYADIVVQFRSQKQLEDGTLIQSNIEIASHYLKSDFFFDVLASFPFEILFSKDSLFNYTPILKLVRVFRLVKIIKFLRVVEDIKASLKLLVLVFYLFIYLHFCTCFWWLIIKDTKTWIHPSLFAHNTPYKLYTLNKNQQYNISLYTAVQMMLICDI